MLLRTTLTLCVVLVACKGKEAAPAKTEAPAKAAPAPAPEPAKPAEPAPVAAGKGTIKGVVSFSGTAPAAEPINMVADKKCVELGGAKADDYVINDGKLANVYVRVTGVPAGDWPMPEAKPVLDQKGCMYSPKLLALRTGQEFEIVNSDPTLHNIHAFGKQEFNVGMPLQGQRLTKKFKKEELVQVKCDVHPWMEAHIGVSEHPFFAVSDASGAFTIADVPAGKYTVEGTHPKLGTASAEVEVTADGEATITLGLAAK